MLRAWPRLAAPRSCGGHVAPAGR